MLISLREKEVEDFEKWYAPQDKKTMPSENIVMPHGLANFGN